MSTKRKECARRLKNSDGVIICSCGCGRIPVKPRKTWFSQQCVDDWRIKNDPGYVRAEVLKRDKGICANCGLDCEELAERFTRAVRKALQKSYSGKWYSPHSALYDHRCRHLMRWVKRNGYQFDGRIHSLWQADHIIPVVEGGGQCGLENYRTLCLGCHKKETAALAFRRSKAGQLASKAAFEQPSLF